MASFGQIDFEDLRFLLEVKKKGYENQSESFSFEDIEDFYRPGFLTLEEIYGILYAKKRRDFLFLNHGSLSECIVCIELEHILNGKSNISFEDLKYHDRLFLIT